MPLTLVTGPANAAKAGHVLDAVRALADRRPLLVVPTWQDAAHYERELAAQRPVFGPAVVRFGGLVDEIAARAGCPARAVPAAAARRLVRATVAGARLDALAASAATPGFAAATADLLAELERSLIDPPRFAAALRAWAGPDGVRSAIARDVAALVVGHRRLLDRLGVVDRELRARRAVDALRAAPERWGDTPVLLYGFDDLTALQRDAVETLARLCGAPVTVALAFEAGHAAFHGRATAVEELKPLADRVVVLPDQADHYAPHARRALHHVERALFGDAAEALPGEAAEGAIEVLEAGGERAELELVAARVLRLIDDGVAPERIAVVLRSPAAAAPLVRQVLDAYGVPHRVAGSVPLGHTPLGRALLGLLRAALLADGTAADLLAWLRAPGLLDVPALADDLERRMRREGTGSARRARELWEADRWPLDELDRLAEAAGRPGGLPGAVARAATRVFERPRRRAAAVLGDDELLDARALGAVREALDAVEGLAALDPALAPGPGELVEELAALEVALDRGGGDPAGGVEVTDPLAIRARRYHAVFVCGLVEGVWPPPPRVDPFLDDERRREINIASGLRLAPADRGLDDERYAFYAAVSRPEALLVLSHRSSDEEGNPVVASPFVEDVRDLFADRLEGVTRRRLLADVTWPADAAPTPREAARAAAVAAPRRPERPLAPLRGEASLRRLAEQAAFSAGAVETWAACPVRWFVERHLRPEALDPDAEPLRRGGAAHDALARTLARLGREHGTARVDAATLAAARRIAAEELEAVVGDAPLHPDPTRNAGLLRRLRADLDRFLRREAECPSGWEPRWVELSFGGAGDPDWDPAVRDGDDAPRLDALVLGDGEVRLRGVIDRVDVDPAGRAAIVRDYKLSRAVPLAAWAGDGNVQAAVYLLAVDRLLGLWPVAALYQPLTGDQLRPRGIVREDPAACGLERAGCYDNDVVPADEFAACLRWAEEFVLDQVRGIRAGALEPRPTTCTPRGRCAHPGICRSPVG